MREALPFIYCGLQILIMAAGRTPRQSPWAPWVQFVLDNYATTAEAVAGLEELQLQIIAPKLPTGHKPTVHISITDRDGDSAIVEYIKGTQVFKSQPFLYGDDE